MECFTRSISGLKTKVWGVLPLTYLLRIKKERKKKLDVRSIKGVKFPLGIYRITKEKER